MKTTSEKQHETKNYQTNNNLCYHDTHTAISPYIVASSSSHLPLCSLEFLIDRVKLITHFSVLLRLLEGQNKFAAANYKSMMEKRNGFH
jgi:uncharacterized protein (DUF2225 family)